MVFMDKAKRKKIMKEVQVMSKKLLAKLSKKAEKRAKNGNVVLPSKFVNDHMRNYFRSC